MKKQCTGMVGDVKNNKLEIRQCDRVPLDDNSMCEQHNKYYGMITDEQLNLIANWAIGDEFGSIGYCTHCNRFIFGDDIHEKILPFCDDCMNDGNEEKTDDKIEPKTKLCSKCKTVLDINFKYAKCDSCRERERMKDQRARDKIRELNKKNKDNPYCISCCKQYGLEHYQSENGQTEVCQTCRNKMKEVEKNRGKRHRNWKEEMDNNPERKQKKEQWKSDNYDKVAKYSMDSRGRKIERLGIDEYRKQQADSAAKYRKKNPDKMNEYNKKKRSDVSQKIKIYKRKSKDRGEEWNLTDDEASDLIKGNCFYCNDPCPIDSLNGIDRLENNGHYDIENCVSCCMECNDIKRCLDPIIFIKRAEHILTYNGIVNGELHYDLYYDYNASSYDSYKDRATKHNIKFSLTVSNYDTLTEDDCYICGKKTDDNHSNGIDRFDNNIGYDIFNSRSCCAECNYMKNDFVFAKFIDKLYKIYKNHIMNITSDISESNLCNNDDIPKHIISHKLYSKFGKSKYDTKYGTTDIDYSLLNRKSIVKTNKKRMTDAEKQDIRIGNQLEKNKKLINNNTNDEYKLQKISRLKELNSNKISEL